MAKKLKPTIINQKRLVKMFKDIKRLNSFENRFCFLIGAGSSKSSGIKTGWELSKEWYNNIKEDLEKEELAAWEKEIAFDEKRIGEFYPYLYRKRYEVAPQIGYDEFKNIMEQAEPGIGYVILSQILANERHNFVITTNFDYLIEDSVRMYTATKPFTAGHETLAEFISSQTERPTIIKVHRDLFLHPFNDTDETEKLKKEWKKALMPILKNFNLLVVGYGGNDGSLMDYLKSIDAEDRKAIYWCVRNENEINKKIENLLDTKDFIVKIEGFDELMISLNDALDYTVFDNLDEPEKHTFVIAANQRIVDLNEKRNQLLKNIQGKKIPINKETKEIFDGALKYIANAYMEKNKDKANNIYIKGLEQFPNDVTLLGSYALFNFYIYENYDKAEKYYKKALKLNPKNANNIASYANFLGDIRKNYDKAEEYYKKAIELEPNVADIIMDYANFLTDIRKSFSKAENYYKKAIELESDDVDIIMNYANFLTDIESYDKAEDYYLKGIKLKPDDVDIITDYANFLVNIREDYDKAEEYYKKAIELEPNDADIIMDYANFLTDIRKSFGKAENYYKKAIELESDDVDIIMNYANFLTDIESYDKAEDYYIKAIELKSNATFVVANYANFLSNIRNDYDKAEEYYKKTIELKPNDAEFIVSYAHFLITVRKDFENAAIKISQSFKLVDDNNLSLLVELWFYRYAHYREYLTIAEKQINSLISKGAKSNDWNLQSDIEIAKENKHPNIKKLKEFANKITKS